MTAIKYRREIDGLRAFAVIPVILFHLGATWISGGFTGVDVFFVISGFLITSIIIRDHQQDRFSLAEFWKRRIKRILPVLLAVVLTTLVFNYLIGYRNDISSLGWQAIWTMVSGTNIFVWNTAGNYWGINSERLAFLHFWSLSVEEQFYLFYPLLLTSILKIKPKLVFPAIAFMALVSLALFLPNRDSTAAFYLLPFRAWELGAGCLLALWGGGAAKNNPRWAMQVLPALGLLILLISYATIQVLGLKLLLPVFGACLIIGFGSAEYGVGRLLSLSPIVYIGKISYSLYVWHWPIIVFAKVIRPGSVDSPLFPVVLFAATFILAALSYHFIETPWRTSPRTLNRIPWAFASCLALAVLLTRVPTSGAYDTSSFNPLRYQVHKYTVAPKPSFDPILKTSADIAAEFRDPADADAWSKNGIVRQYGGPIPEVVVIGDSHACMWSALIDDLCRSQHKTVSFFGAAGVSPFVTFPLKSQHSEAVGFTLQEKILFDERKSACIAKWKPTVILSVRWSSFHDIEQMRDLFDFLRKAQCKVILLEQPPEIRIREFKTNQYLAYLGYRASEENQYFFQDNQDKVRLGREVVRQIVKVYPFCQIVPTYDFFARGDTEALVIKGQDFLYADGNHLSSAGVYQFRAPIADAIGKAGT